MGSGAEDDTNVGIFTSDILQSVIHSEVRMFLNCFFFSFTTMLCGQRTSMSNGILYNTNVQLFTTSTIHLC